MRRLRIKLKSTARSLISDGKFSEIFRGSVWSLLARIVVTMLSFVVNIVVVRIFGAEIMGIIILLNSFLVFATTFTVFGTNTSILRLIPEHLVKYSATSAFKMYRKTQLMVIGFSFLTSALLFGFSGIIAEKVFHKPYLSFYISLTAFFVVFKSLMDLNTHAVRGIKLIKAFVLMQLLPNLAKLLLLFVIGCFFFSKNAPIYALMGSFLITAIAGWLIMDIEFKKRIDPNDDVCLMPAKDILAISLPMLLNSAMGLIMAQTGVIMLGIFRDDAEVGYYGIAVKLGMLTSFVLSSINTIAAPKFSEYFHSGEIDNLFYVAKKSTKLIFWTTLPILLVLLLLGKVILANFFGREFTVAYGALIYLIIGQFVNAVCGSTGLFMSMTGHQNVFRNILLIAVLINISVNYFFIPTVGINAAAIASMCSAVFWNLVTICYIKIKFGRTTCYLPFQKLMKE